MKFSLVTATLAIAAGVQASVIPKECKYIDAQCPGNAALVNVNDNCYSYVNVSDHVQIEKRHHNKKHTTKHHHKKDEHNRKPVPKREPRKHKKAHKAPKKPKNPEHKSKKPEPKPKKSDPKPEPKKD